jgi:micrococcal nuclease
MTNWHGALSILMHFSDLSPLLLIALGFVLCLLAIWLLLRVRAYMQVKLVPFKKGQRYWCKIIAVSDGDTITCQRLNLRRSQSKMRFAYIDAPESKQAYGAEATKLLRGLILNKWVSIEITDNDRYGRQVGVVYRRGKNINQELVKRGAAWVYEDYIRDPNLKKQFLALQANAKSKKRGLWQASRPVHPSVYRKSS